uniref:four helix bundle protein n=1 Tax=Trichocoleus desertorum TaxID=1481672 RepID=UPI0025B2A654|nr:four helix bundle protein [Trichocoleus desertorum]
MEEQVSITSRTKQFAIRIIKACHFLEQQPGVLKTLSNQLVRSGTSIGANVHEAQSAQSHRDFLSKLEIALKEARETQYWIEVLIASGMVETAKFNSLLQEATEITKILITSTKKLKNK